MTGALPDLEELAPYLDRALSTGEIVVFAGYALVPDLVLLEGVAQGHDIERAPTIVRCDGRSVAVYLIPGVDR